jgi:hypothetical protein
VNEGREERDQPTIRPSSNHLIFKVIKPSTLEFQLRKEKRDWYILYEEYARKHNYTKAGIYFNYFLILTVLIDDEY